MNRLESLLKENDRGLPPYAIARRTMLLGTIVLHDRRTEHNKVNQFQIRELNRLGICFQVDHYSSGLTSLCLSRGRINLTSLYDYIQTAIDTIPSDPLRQALLIEYLELRLEQIKQLKAALLKANVWAITAAYKDKKRIEGQIGKLFLPSILFSLLSSPEVFMDNTANKVGVYAIKRLNHKSIKTHV